VVLFLLALAKVIGIFMKLPGGSRGRRKKRTGGRGEEEGIDPIRLDS